MDEHSTVAGWRVDRRCTNCDAARQLAPELVAEVAGRSSVIRQPRTDAEEKALHAAAFACHTRSIRHGVRGPHPALDPFPLRLTEHVHLCGHNSPHTAGANSYLLRRPAGNLMMIDTPRWSSALASKYSALGPITDVLLTHRDHAAPVAHTPTGSAPASGSTRETWPLRHTPTVFCEAPSRSGSPTV